MSITPLFMILMWRCLHARGDEPPFEKGLNGTQNDVSTHVEMNRPVGGWRYGRDRCLHARGDEPDTAAAEKSTTPMSPRTWR